MKRERIEMYRNTYSEKCYSNYNGYKSPIITGRESIGSGFLLDFIAAKNEDDEDEIMAIVADKDGNVGTMPMYLIRIEIEEDSITAKRKI